MSVPLPELGDPDWMDWAGQVHDATTTGLAGLDGRLDTVEGALEASAGSMAYAPATLTDWSRRPDGPVAHQDLSDAGTAFHISPSAAGQTLTVANRRLEVGWPNTDGGAIYLNETVPGVIKRLGMTVGYGPGGDSTTVGAIAMVTWTTPYPQVSSDAQIHFTMSRGGWALDIVVDGVVTGALGSETFATPLVGDWRPYTVEAVIVDNTLTLVLPHGLTHTVTHSLIGATPGNTACWEFFKASGNTYGQAIYQMWADTTPIAPSGSPAAAGRLTARAIASALGTPYPPAAVG